MHIQVCTGKACCSRFSKYIITRIENDTSFYDYKKIKLEESGCMGQCKKGPNVKIGNQTHNYVSPAKASELINKAYK